MRERRAVLECFAGLSREKLRAHSAFLFSSPFALPIQRGINFDWLIIYDCQHDSRAQRKEEKKATALLKVAACCSFLGFLRLVSLWKFSARQREATVEKKERKLKKIPKTD